MNASTPMPQYQCHKKVWALKIEKVEHNHDGTATITPEEKHFAPLQVPVDYVNKHQPQVGGYYVVYEDGYKSYSPAKAFEDGYTRI